MKNTTNAAAAFFAHYFKISVDEAKELNHMTLDCMVKYAEQVQAKDVARFRDELKKYDDGCYDGEVTIENAVKVFTQI